MKAREKMLEVKQQRIQLAQKEFEQLSQTLIEYQKRQSRKTAKTDGKLFTAASTSNIPQNLAVSKTSRKSPLIQNIEFV